MLGRFVDGDMVSFSAYESESKLWAKDLTDRLVRAVAEFANTFRSMVLGRLPIRTNY